jgi:hypothetical protein
MIKIVHGQRGIFISLTIQVVQHLIYDKWGPVPHINNGSSTGAARRGVKQASTRRGSGLFPISEVAPTNKATRCDHVWETQVR